MKKSLRRLGYLYLIVFVMFTLLGIVAHVAWSGEPFLEMFHQAIEQCVQLYPVYVLYQWLRYGTAYFWPSAFAVMVCYIGPVGSAHAFSSMPHVAQAMYAIYGPLTVAMAILTVDSAIKRKWGQA